MTRREEILETVIIEQVSIGGSTEPHRLQVITKDHSQHHGVIHTAGTPDHPHISTMINAPYVVFTSTDAAAIYLVLANQVLMTLAKVAIDLATGVEPEIVEVPPVPIVSTHYVDALVRVDSTRELSIEEVLELAGEGETVLSDENGVIQTLITYGNVVNESEDTCPECEGEGTVKQHEADAGYKNGTKTTIETCSNCRGRGVVYDH